MYQVKKHGSYYAVVESQTNQVIVQVPSYNEARIKAKSLTRGRGFRGFTPSFFVSNNAPKSIWDPVDIYA